MGNLRRLFLSGDNRQEYEMKFTGIQRCCSEPNRRKGGQFAARSRDSLVGLIGYGFTGYDDPRPLPLLSGEPSR